LQKSKDSFFTNDFSHIYIEKEAWKYPLTLTILQRFPHANRIEIDRYQDVFNRSKQNFFLQKHAPKLILAVKKAPFLYRGAEVCHDFGNTYFYYTSSALNCLYNCEYCFLQGMFPSANIVLFVNIDDYFTEVSHTLQKHPVYLAISYETDLLAFERIAPYVSKWIDYAREQEDLLLEVRSKSANYSAIQHLEPASQVILAWTLSPDAVIQQFEAGTPNLTARLKSLRQAIDDGWKVRICFDPVLHIENWQEHYRECIEHTFSVVPAEKIQDISIGVFRIPRDYLKKIRKHRIDSALLHYPFESHDGVFSYPHEIAKQLIDHVYQHVNTYVPKEKIYI
jgi:spore photoproduct lyase